MRATIISALLAVLVCSDWGNAARPTTQEIKELMQRMEAVKKADYDLSGEIVDETGQRVPNVVLSIEKGVTKNFGLDANYSYTREVSTDGTFHIKVSGASNANISFLLEGYFAKEIGFSGKDGLPPDWEERMLRGETFKPGIVKRENLKVVLEKHGPLASLERGGGAFDLYADGKAKAWSWEKNYPGFKVEVENWRDESSLPKNGIYFLVDTDDQGSFAMIPGPYQSSFRPRKIRVIMKDGDGFLVVPSVGNDVKQYRGMKEAPEKGYTSELILDGEALKKHMETSNDSSKGGLYFYFKTSKGYGKGCLMVHYSNRATEAQITLVLRFQKDGSRLVATED